MVQRVGPFILGKILGVGSTGKVRLGTHEHTGHSVAIKIVSKEWLASRASLTKKIEREITVMKLVKHPNVLHLYDVYESDTDLFLVLEHIEGGELFDYLVRRGRLPEPEALIFFQQIIGGLDFCHQHMIFHRDLKPENLLLDAKLNVKIADFGMATLQISNDKKEKKMLETSCGSPHYASPEIIRGILYDGGPADIWSCGVILYALLTGNLPFDDENIRKLLGKVKAGMYFLPPSLSEGSQNLIKSMLVLDPTKRITMKGIKEHPWFVSATSRAVFPPPVDILQISSPDDIDSNIVTNLCSLGWEEEALIKAIIDESDTVEKVFYTLLYERKEKYFENIDDDAWEDPAGPRRREDSFSTEFRQRRLSEARISSDGTEEGGRKRKDSDGSLRKNIPRRTSTSGRPGKDASEDAKRSWFSTLFNFKGEVVTIHVTTNFADTSAAVQKALESAECKIQANKEGQAFKCKFDGGSSGKGCKFRVEILNNDPECEVLFVQQQGQTATFKNFLTQLKSGLSVK